MEKDYYVYILTNPNKTVLYIGVTNNSHQRLIVHYLNRGWSRKKKETLIRTKNPEFRFLNIDLLGSWPPPDRWNQGSVD